MNHNDYTNDAICQSMGLHQFLDEELGVGALRVLLKPSFSSEVCITIVDGASLQVVALREMLWRQPAVVPMTTFREQWSLDGKVAEKLLSLFQAALEAHNSEEGRMVVICDGMAMSGYHLKSEGPVVLNDHPYRTESSNFVASLINTAWNVCKNPGVCNALSACGRYVSLKLPLKEMPKTNPQYNIAVIGVKDDRSDAMEQINEKSTR